MDELNTMESAESANAVDKEGKTIGVIAYITLIGLIIAFVMNNDKKSEFASYHIRQSLGLGITGLALGIIGMIPIIGWIIDIIAIFILLYMWIVGIMNASKNKMKPVPLLGEKYAEWFNNVG